MEELTHFSLFSGIGGIDLAAEWAGFKTVGQCEWADYPTKVLEKHWPDVPRWRDVHDVTGDNIKKRGIGRITLLSGGFPCQPHSIAGKRLASADERDLWGEYARVICEVRPKWVLGENVPGLLSSESGRFFGRVLNDLAKMGYNAGWCVYGADQVGSPHKRDRIFIIANVNSSRMGFEKLANTCEKPDAQTNKTFSTIRNKINARDDVGGGYWRTRPEPGWAVPKSELVRMAHGLSNGLDALGCLGNAVVPQQIYPILQAIADIERSIKECMQ